MRSILLITISLLLTGCFTTTLVAPENMPVRILPQNERASFQTEFKDWYIFAGIIPIYRHDLATLIKDEQLVEVRVRTEDRISDGVITFATEMLGFILPIFPQSLVVEGNTAAQKTASARQPAQPSGPAVH